MPYKVIFPTEAISRSGQNMFFILCFLRLCGVCDIFNISCNLYVDLAGGKSPKKPYQPPVEIYIQHLYSTCNIFPS